MGNVVERDQQSSGKDVLSVLAGQLLMRKEKSVVVCENPNYLLPGHGLPMGCRFNGGLLGLHRSR